MNGGILLKAVGDVLGVSTGGGDPFVHVASELRRCDILFGNLEGVISAQEQPAAEKAILLRSAPGTETALARAGFTVLNLANNHCLDYGPEAALETRRRVQDAGIRAVGTGRDEEEAWQEAGLDVRGRRIAFFGATEGVSAAPGSGCAVARFEPQRILRRIRELKERYDRVILSLHWGMENILLPSPDQQRWARAFIEAGASVILGHHAHRVQGIERYQDGVICYSLGNFNFLPCGVGLAPHENTSTTVEIRLEEQKAPEYRMTPVVLDSSYCPRIVEAEPERSRLLAHFSDISRPLAAGLDEYRWRAEIARPYLLGNLRAFGVRIRRYGWRHAVACLRWLAGGYNRKIYAAVLRRGLARKGRTA